MEYEKLDVTILSDDERREMAINAHEGATHYCVVTRRFITNNNGIYMTMMSGSMAQFDWPCELVPIDDVIGSVKIEEFSHGEQCICHDTADGRNYGIAIYMCKALSSGYSLIRVRGAYSGDHYAAVKDIALSKIK